MSISQALPVVLGTLAVASGTALLSLDVIFAVTLSQAHSVLAARTPAIVASGLGLVGVALLTLLLGRQIRYRNGAHIQDIGRGPQHTYLLAGCGAIFCILFAVASAVFLALMLARLEDLPTKTVQSSTRSLIVGAFIIWAVSMISQALFIICIIILQKKGIQHGSLFHPETPTAISSEMKESSRPHSQNRPETAEDHGTHSLDSRSSPSSGSGRSRAGSDTFSSFRSSLSGVVRPITSKTRLVSSGQKGSHRPTSLDSGYRDTVVSIEDGFDSWDTSAVDSQSRLAIMESGSPTPPRTAFPLETIPASPTTSRSPSPGFPLDLEPPKSRTRSRSYSPAGSFVERRRDTRTASPTPSIHEAHIHPLFRTDSPEPPPAATPGTIITAAPSAGQVLSSRSSVKSLRMRSGSFPASPLAHSDSLDSIRRVMEQEDRQIQEAGVERTITPPLPSWVLSSAPSPRLASYESRRKTPTGLGKLGEAGEF